MVHRNDGCVQTELFNFAGRQLGGLVRKKDDGCGRRVGVVVLGYRKACRAEIRWKPFKDDPISLLEGLVRIDGVPIRHTEFEVQVGWRGFCISAIADVGDDLAGLHPDTGFNPCKRARESDVVTSGYVVAQMEVSGFPTIPVADVNGTAGVSFVVGHSRHRAVLCSDHGESPPIPCHDVDAVVLACAVIPTSAKTGVEVRRAHDWENQLLRDVDPLDRIWRTGRGVVRLGLRHF